MTDEQLPHLLTLDEAFRAAYFMVDRYIALESNPDKGLVLLSQYLKSDPARWSDWEDSIRAAVSDASADQEGPLRD